jgi:hypothetical protein
MSLNIGFIIKLIQFNNSQNIKKNFGEFGIKFPFISLQLVRASSFNANDSLSIVHLPNLEDLLCGGSLFSRAFI